MVRRFYHSSALISIGGHPLVVIHNDHHTTKSEQPRQQYLGELGIIIIRSHYFTTTTLLSIEKVYSKTSIHSFNGPRVHRPPLDDPLLSY